MNTKTLPLPVKRNKFGRNVDTLTVTEYYRQIEEEVLEAYAEAIKAGMSEKKSAFIDSEAEELVDIIATCITRLDIIGYDESARQKLYDAVNEKNHKRGYF